jgi:hypothetical protein
MVLLRLTLFPVLAVLPFIGDLSYTGVVVFLALPKLNGTELLEHKYET